MTLVVDEVIQFMRIIFQVELLVPVEEWVVDQLVAVVSHHALLVPKVTV